MTSKVPWLRLAFLLAEEVADYRDFWRAPPTDAMYFHRKLGGMFLLASRVKARVDVNQLIKRFIG